MKLWYLIIFLGMTSCGISYSLKSAKYMEDKGYNRNRDTIDIKPYQYFIYNKGYFPMHEELKPENPIAFKIQINGYENKDTLPFDRIFKPFQMNLDELKIDSITFGKVIYYTGLTYYVKYIGCPCNDINGRDISFEQVKKGKENWEKIVLYYFGV
jgi:hypothetical protein